jgi:hypothetical protein
LLITTFIANLITFYSYQFFFKPIKTSKLLFLFLMIKAVYMNSKLQYALGVFFLTISSVFGAETPAESSNSVISSQSNCDKSSKNSGNCFSKIKSWMGSKEENQGRNHFGPRHQGVRPTPLYMYFQPSCAEKNSTGSCNNNLNWSPTGWRDFTSTGHRMFDTPAQFGVGSGQK